MSMNWISVEDRLPDQGTFCFVAYADGYGYGSYEYEGEYEYVPMGYKPYPGAITQYYRYRQTNKLRWFLDFDACGNEDTITHWCEVEEPE